MLARLRTMRSAVFHWFLNLIHTFLRRRTTTNYVCKAAESSPTAIVPRQHSRFLPHDAMLARYMQSSCVRLSVCLSVRLSVTSQYCIKNANCRITQATPYDDPAILVFWCGAKDLGEILTGSPQRGRQIDAG